MLLLVGLLFAGIEGGLRWMGYGGHPRLFRAIAEVESGVLVSADVAMARSFFFANRNRPGFHHTATFMDPKPEGVFRVLMAGGSAIKGYPQPYHLAPSAFLRAMLEDAWPERRVEVLNLGTTAAASFPVMELTLAGLEFDPDLVVVFAGHNEFFGAYGTASRHRAGGYPWMLRWHRRLHGLAMVQALREWWPAPTFAEGATLMEMMVGRAQVPPDHWRRDAAERNLGYHLHRIAEACKERSIPLMVCTLPTNERDLAPLGDSPLRRELPADVGGLRRWLERSPFDALAHYRLARWLFEEGEEADAARHFRLARDFDPMPWRATSRTQAAIREVAERPGVMLCDVEELFRSKSPGGAIGWEWMDDHVHPSLPGQALVARALVERLVEAEGRLRVSTEAFAGLDAFEGYAERLGDNRFDRYGVDHHMRVLFSIPFMKETNPEGFARFQGRAVAFERSLSPDLLEIVKQWQGRSAHAGAQRPITGMIARGLLRRDEVTEAQRLFEIARRAVPPFTSWHMEYLYFDLACREKLQGGLTEEDLALAGEELERGRILLAHGFGESGLTERYMGRLHQLRGEYGEAIPYLWGARPRLSGFDVVATDQALVMSYLRTGQPDRAREILAEGIAQGGEFARFYRAMDVGIMNSPDARERGAPP